MNLFCGNINLLFFYFNKSTPQHSETLSKTANYISFLKKNSNPREFLDRAYALAQSASTFLDDGVLDIKIQIIKCIQGSARARVSRFQTEEERASRKRSVFNVINDQMCGYIAIAVGKVWADEGQANTSCHAWRSIKSAKTADRKAAASLFTSLAFDASSPLNIQTISDLQSILTEYQLIVVDQKTQLKLFAGDEQDKQILLEYSEPAHFNLITNLKG